MASRALLVLTSPYASCSPCVNIENAYWRYKKTQRPSARQPETPDIRNDRDLKTSSASMSKVSSAVEKVVRLNEAKYSSKLTVTNIR